LVLGILEVCIGQVRSEQWWKKSQNRASRCVTNAEVNCKIWDNLVEDENGDLIADSHNIFSIWKNYIFQLLNVCSVSIVRQIEIQTAEPLLPHPIPFEVEVAIAKLERYKSPGSDQISAELIKAGGEMLGSKTHKLTNFI
jgi:hypothetical protein